MKKRTDIFVSYAKEDAKWLAPLMPHLQMLETQFRHVAFTDRSGLKIGDDWQEEIDAALASMRVFVFLVSANSLGKAYINDHEIPVARQRAKDAGVRIMPVLVKHCAWENTKWLSAKQFHRTGDQTQPVPLESLPSEAEIDRVLTALAQKIIAVLATLPPPPSANGDREFLVKLCDRQPQYREFQSQTTKTLEELKFRMQVWFVHGGQQQALLSFTDRLHEQSLKRHPRILQEEARSPARFEIDEWPEPADPDAADRLISALMESLQERSTAQLPAGADFRREAAPLFAQLWAGLAETVSLITIRHEARGSESLAECLPLLFPYVEFLNAAVLAATAPATVLTRLPPLIFFVCVPAGDSLWPPLLGGSTSSLEKQLAPLRAAAPLLEIREVPKLESVKKEDVRAWFREHGAKIQISDETEWSPLCEELFGWLHRTRPMLEVQQHLTAIVKKTAPK